MWLRRLHIILWLSSFQPSEIRWNGLLHPWGGWQPEGTINTIIASSLGMQALQSSTGVQISFFLAVMFFFKKIILYWRRIDLHSSRSDSMVKNPSAMQEPQEMWVQLLSREDSLEKGMAAHSSIPAWEIPWTEEHGSYSPWGCQELDMTE